MQPQGMFSSSTRTTGAIRVSLPEQPQQNRRDEFGDQLCEDAFRHESLPPAHSDYLFFNLGACTAGTVADIALDPGSVFFILTLASLN